MKLFNKKREGFTLAELMIAAGVLAFLLTGLLAVFINSILTNETNRNLALAYTAVEAKMEEVKDIAFTNLDSLNGTTFALNGLSSGSGRIEVTNESSILKMIRIRACFMNRNRLVGNDLNNCTSSSVELITLITQ